MKGGGGERGKDCASHWKRSELMGGLVADQVSVLVSDRVRERGVE